MKLALGNLTSGHLGAQVTGTPAQRTHGVPKPTGPITGKLESVHHFDVDGTAYTAAIVRVPRTRREVEMKMPDCRELRGPSATEVELPQ